MRGFRIYITSPYFLEVWSNYDCPKAKKSTFGNKHFNVGYSTVELKCLKMGGYTHKTYQNDAQGMIMPIEALRMMYQLC